MSTLKDSDAETILELNNVLPQDVQNLHKEICRFFSLDDMNIIDRAQSASQFSAFVRSGYYARKRKKEKLIQQQEQLKNELKADLALPTVAQFKFDQTVSECYNAIKSGMAFSENAARLITPAVRQKIIDYMSIAPQIDDIQMSIDYLNDMFDVSKNYSFNINTAAKMITSER